LKFDLLIKEIEKLICKCKPEVYYQEVNGYMVSSLW